jgi:hypothetical protein
LISVTSAGNSGNDGCGMVRFLALAAMKQTARFLETVSAPNAKRYQIMPASFGVLDLFESNRPWANPNSVRAIPGFSR